MFAHEMGSGLPAESVAGGAASMQTGICDCSTNAMHPWMYSHSSAVTFFFLVRASWVRLHTSSTVTPGVHAMSVVLAVAEACLTLYALRSTTHLSEPAAVLPQRRSGAPQPTVAPAYANGIVVRYCIQLAALFFRAIAVLLEVSALLLFEVDVSLCLVSLSFVYSFWHHSRSAQLAVSTKPVKPFPSNNDTATLVEQTRLVESLTDILVVALLSLAVRISITVFHVFIQRNGRL